MVATFALVILSGLGCLPDDPHLPMEPIGSYPDWGNEKSSPKPLSTTELTPPSQKAQIAETVSAQKQAEAHEKQNSDRAPTGAQRINGEALAQGKNIFEARCALCHQKTGAGAPHMQPIPDMRQEAFQQSRSDAALAMIISGGKGRMPAFQATLTEDQIKAVVTYIRKLQQ